MTDEPPRDDDKAEVPTTGDVPKKPKRIPAIFATIHFKSPHRPNGYTEEDLDDIHRLLNPPDEDEE